MKKIFLFAMAGMMLAACGSKSATGQGASYDNVDEEVIQLMKEYAEAGKWRQKLENEIFESARDRHYDKLSQSERAAFAAEQEKKFKEAEQESQEKRAEIEQRLHKLAETTLGEREIEAVPDEYSAELLEVVSPFVLQLITPEKIVFEATVKILIDREIKFENRYKRGVDYKIKASFEDAEGHSLIDEFIPIRSKDIDDYSNNLKAGTEVDLSYTITPQTKHAEEMMATRKIVLFWECPTDEFNGDMGAEI